MISLSRRWFGAFVLVIALLSTSANGQTPVNSFEDLQQTLRIGQSVVVTDQSGHRFKGKVVSVSASSFRVGSRIFTEATVREIRLSDPLWNGAMIGGGIGAGLATWDYMIDPSEPGNAAIFAVAIGLGTAIGAGVDALSHKAGRLVYTSGRQGAK